MQLDIHIQNKLPVDLTARSASFKTLCNTTSISVDAETLVFVLPTCSWWVLLQTTHYISPLLSVSTNSIILIPLTLQSVLSIIQPDLSRHLYYKFCSLPLQSCYTNCRVHEFRWEEHYVKGQQAVLKISMKLLYHHSLGMTRKPVNIISSETWCQFKVWSTHLDIPGNEIIRL
jgi:hypothetical protein